MKIDDNCCCARSKQRASCHDNLVKTVELLLTVYIEGLMASGYSDSLIRSNPYVKAAGMSLALVKLYEDAENLKNGSERIAKTV